MGVLWPDCLCTQKKQLKGTKIDIDLGMSAFSNARRSASRGLAPPVLPGRVACSQCSAFLLPAWPSPSDRRHLYPPFHSGLPAPMHSLVCVGAYFTSCLTHCTLYIHTYIHTSNRGSYQHNYYTPVYYRGLRFCGVNSGNILIRELSLWFSSRRQQVRITS